MISEQEAEFIKNSIEDKLINGKYLNKNDFLSLKLWFEDIIKKKCRSEQGLAEQFKIILFELNANNNGLINLIQFLDEN